MTTLLMLVMAGVAADPAAYTFGPGDEIQVTVYDNPEISRAVHIGDSCDVRMEFIGPVMVCDRSATEIGDEVADRLREGQFLRNPEVLVQVVTFGSRRVEVKGAVHEPGVQILKGRTSLSQVITEAGGPAEENVVEVVVVRADNSTDTYDVGSLSPEVLVRAGDTVILKHGRFVNVLGEVTESGPVPYRAGLTVTEALGLAGGPTQFASRRRAHILRSNGEKIKVNIRRITQGVEHNEILQPDDQVVVKRTVF